MNRSDREPAGRIREVLGIIADSAGHRFMTVERVFEDAQLAELAEMTPWDSQGEYQVVLWELDRLDQPLATLRPQPFRSRQRSQSNSSPPPRLTAPPLVAISPDGWQVAVSPRREPWVYLYSGLDGRGRGGPDERSLLAPIPTQTELNALALGPNGLLAMAGGSGTAGGGTVRLYDLETRKTLATLTPTQSWTGQMRFSPQGTLLALIGMGPIELWDPAAHSLVAVLRMSQSDPPTDLAISPDGRTLAAGGRGTSTSIWTVTESVARTQLSGFDARLSSLAFGSDGTLAGGVWDGDVWYWRHGRCPEIRSAQAESLKSGTDSTSTPTGPRPASTPEKHRDSDTSQPTFSTNRSDRNDRRSEPPGRGGPNRTGAMNPAFVAFDSGGRLVAHDSQGLRIWPAGSIDVPTPSIIRVALPPAEGQPWQRATARTSDGHSLVLARSSSVFLWRAETPNRVQPVIPPLRSVTESPPFSKTGPRRETTAGADSNGPRFLAVQVSPLGDRIYLIDDKNTLHTWALDASSEGCHARTVSWKTPLPSGITSLALRPDGGLLAVVNRSGTVTLLDTNRLTVASWIKLPNEETVGIVLAMVFSPDGRDLAIGTPPGSILIWSLAKPNPKEPRLRLPGNRGMFAALAYDSRGQRLASAMMMDPLVEVWDLVHIRRDLADLGLPE